MSLNKRILNAANVGGGDNAPLARTLKATYCNMGVRNFLFTKRDGFDATGVVFEYD